MGKLIFCLLTFTLAFVLGTGAVRLMSPQGVPLQTMPGAAPMREPVREPPKPVQRFVWIGSDDEGSVHTRLFRTDDWRIVSESSHDFPSIRETRRAICEQLGISKLVVYARDPDGDRYPGVDKTGRPFVINYHGGRAYVIIRGPDEEVVREFAAFAFRCDTC
jgi:hypothetical protein